MIRYSRGCISFHYFPHGGLFIRTVFNNFVPNVEVDPFVHFTDSITSMLTVLIGFKNDDVYVPIVVLKYYLLFPKHDLPNYITEFVLAWATRHVPHLEQYLLTLPEQLINPSFCFGSCCSVNVFSMFNELLFVCLFSFFFGHGVDMF